VRIDREVRVGPVSVPGKDSVPVGEIVVEARVELIVVAADTGVGRIVVDVRELDTWAVTPGPKIRHYLRRGIDAAGGNDVAGERAAGNDLVTAGISRTRSVAETAAGCEGVIDGNHRAAGVANVGEVARAHGIGWDGKNVGGALPEFESFPTSEEEGPIAFD